MERTIIVNAAIKHVIPKEDALDHPFITALNAQKDSFRFHKMEDVCLAIRSVSNAQTNRICVQIALQKGLS